MTVFQSNVPIKCPDITDGPLSITIFIWHPSGHIQTSLRSLPVHRPPLGCRTPCPMAVVHSRYPHIRTCLCSRFLSFLCHFTSFTLQRYFFFLRFPKKYGEKFLAGDGGRRISLHIEGWCVEKIYNIEEWRLCGNKCSFLQRKSSLFNNKILLLNIGSSALEDLPFL